MQAYLVTVPVEKMQSLAQAVGKHLRPRDVIALSGELGSGKTTFARALINAIAAKEQEVTSPTFNLMQSYDVKVEEKPHILWHLDLYRLKDKKEVEALGLEELWPHIVLIEWPDIIKDRLPAQRLDISFDFGENPDTRTLAFSGDDTWQSRLKNIA